MTDLSSPIFTNDERGPRPTSRASAGPTARSAALRRVKNIKRLAGKSHRPGLHQCNSCREHFTVTVGTVMERSHVSLSKWVLAFHLMAASKKGMSSHQLSRMLGVTYKTAWFMSHRIREAMTDRTPAPIGGEGKVVEADEAYLARSKSRSPAPRARAVPTSSATFPSRSAHRGPGRARRRGSRDAHAARHRRHIRTALSPQRGSQEPPAYGRSRLYPHGRQRVCLA
jgi:transposase-like protein